MTERCSACGTDGVTNTTGRFVSRDWLRASELKTERDALEAEVARLKKVVLACWVALAELSPCIHGECKQPQTEALELALRMAEDVVRPNVEVQGRDASAACRPSPGTQCWA